MLNKKAQIALLSVMHRLSKAGIQATDIANHIFEYGNSQQKIVAQSCLDGIENGKGFSIGLKGHIDPLAYESVSAGEYAGRFQDGLSNALEILRMQMASGFGLLWAVLKPTFGFIGLLFLCSYLGVHGVPALLAKIPPEKQYGASMLILVQDFGSMIDTFLLPLVFLFTATLVGSLISLPLFIGPLRSDFDHLPIYSQYRLISSGNFLGTLANIMRSDVPLKDALEQLLKTANPYMASHIEKMLDAVQYEDNLGTILNTGLLNEPEVMTIKMLGSISGKAETLQRSADMHREILREKTEYIKEYGTTAIKIAAYLVGFAVAGAFVNFLLTIVSF